jgi:hypothetical protein
MEKFQTLQTISQIGFAVFSILAILCGYGTYHYGQKKELVKETLQNSNNLSNQDTTSKNDTTYFVKGDIIHGNKTDNSKKEEINAPSALIVTQNQSGGQNIVNFSQYEWVPLENNLYNQTQQKLLKLSAKYPVHPVTIIEIESGNNQRNKVAEKLEQLLAFKELGSYPKGNTYMGRFPDAPISVIVNPANIQYTSELIDALKDYITGDYKIFENQEFPETHIRVYIYGTPLFDASGRVKVQ